MGKKAAKKPTEPCSPAGATCPAMAMALKAGGERGVGFRVATMCNFASGMMTTELVYYFPKKIDGVAYMLVNQCPWCGETVRAPPPTKKEDADA